MAECLFCKIIKGEIPAKVIFEDETVVAFEDINPKAPTHVLLITRKHIAGLDQAQAGDEALLGHLQRCAAQIAAQQGIEKSGYRTVLNVGPNAGQSVFHIHLHLLGGRPMAWPPG